MCRCRRVIVTQWRVIVPRMNTRWCLGRGWSWLPWRNVALMAIVELSTRVPSFEAWGWRPWVGSRRWRTWSQAGVLCDACPWRHYWRSSRRITREVLYLWTQVIIRTIIWWNARWGVRREISLWNITCWWATTSRAQAKRFSVAIIIDLQGSSRAWLMLYQSIWISAAVWARMKQFMRGSDLNPWTQTGSPRSIFRV